MSLKTQAAKNVSAMWLSLLTHLAVGFFLSPLILHRLGDEAFGLWTLIFSLTGYFGLFDFGIQSSIIRYVAKFEATHHEEQLTRFINTSLATYSAIALAVMLVTGVGCYYLPILFRIPPGMLGTGQRLLLLVGGGVALTFPLSVFAGILGGLQKFYAQHLSQIGFSLLRGILIVIALTRGGGLLAITLITVVVNVVSYAPYLVWALRALPIRLGLRFVDRHALRQILGYGSVAFVILLAEKLRFQSDAVVIGVFLSSTAITYFSIASRLAEYSGYVVQAPAKIFTPMSSQSDAAGDLDRLQKIFVVGNRVCALTIFPLCAALIVLGKPIIEVWVGPKYLSSYPILLLLVVPKTLYLAQATSVKILLGIGRHRMLALVLLLEGAANLVLSAVLLRRWGILGVALGTTIPLSCTSLLFLPRHLCRLLNIPLLTFLRQAYLLPLGLCAPLVAVLLLLKQVFQAHSYSQLFAQVAGGGIVYGAGLVWLFFGKKRRGLAHSAGAALSGEGWTSNRG